MRVLAQQDLAVTLYIPDAAVRPSQHTNAQVTSYLAPNGTGDVAADEAATAFTATTRSTFWLKAIDVQSASSVHSSWGVWHWYPMVPEYAPHVPIVGLHQLPGQSASTRQPEGRHAWPRDTCLHSHTAPPVHCSSAKHSS